MKKHIVILVGFSLIVFYLINCTTKYSRYDPEGKQALRTLAGGAVGALIAGNTGGAIVGALVLDIYNMATIKYEDKQLINGEEAAKKYKDRYKIGEKKEEDKKVEKKEEDKKVEKKEEDKKVEKKEEDKKVEKKREDKKVKLFIEESFVVTQTVKTGSTVEANVQYTLLAPDATQQIKITETRILSAADKMVELDQREVFRTQGTYVSTIKFTMPEDMPKGYCILFTTISAEKYMKSAKSVINII